MSMVDFMLRARALSYRPEDEIDRLVTAWRRQEATDEPEMPEATLRAVLRLARDELERNPLRRPKITAETLKALG